ncbi:MAG TPA: tetratricopeptide repeat protein [Pyrinomonadaceae bacterium]|nr:tetratricopeptide repeat protein [Pyrinomonadaceae bacterium]
MRVDERPRRGASSATLATLAVAALFALGPSGTEAARQARRGARPAPATAARTTSRVLVVKAQPKAAVWVDEVRRGTTDEQGELSVSLSPGAHTLRVRAAGYAERVLPVTAAQRGPLQVRLTPTTDGAELLFQQAEETRERGGGAAKAAELYREALALRPRFPAARVGLARALAATDDHDAALEQVAEARRARPGFAEASAVEGRILRTLGDYDAALESYRRSLREARNFQPEAHTGMGLVFEELSRHEEAVASFRRAIAQLSDTEPVLYELLGRNLERLERWKEAADAYDKYLALAPGGRDAEAVRSIIEQLRRQAAEQEGERPD